METSLSRTQIALKKAFTILPVFLETLENCWHLQSSENQKNGIYIDFVIYTGLMLSKKKKKKKS